MTRMMVMLMMALVVGGAAKAGLQGNAPSKTVTADTIQQRPLMQEGNSRLRKMATSLYPVQISVTGRAVRVQSNHNQLLPIYTRSGNYYMTMRLTKGVNWLNGLPRGRYFINNLPVTIN